MLDKYQCQAHTRTPWGSSAHRYPPALRNTFIALLLTVLFGFIVMVCISVGQYFAPLPLLDRHHQETSDPLLAYGNVVLEPQVPLQQHHQHQQEPDTPHSHHLTTAAESASIWEAPAPAAAADQAVQPQAPIAQALQSEDFTAITTTTTASSSSSSNNNHLDTQMFISVRPVNIAATEGKGEQLASGNQQLAITEDDDAAADGDEGQYYPPFNECGDQFNGCERYYKPNFCCPFGSVCYPSSQSPSGVYCCADPDTCIVDSSHVPSCGVGTISCPSSLGAGCCPTGTTCSPDGCLSQKPLDEHPRFVYPDISDPLSVLPPALINTVVVSAELGANMMVTGVTTVSEPRPTATYTGVKIGEVASRSGARSLHLAGLGSSAWLAVATTLLTVALVLIVL